MVFPKIIRNEYVNKQNMTSNNNNANIVYYLQYDIIAAPVSYIL